MSLSERPSPVVLTDSIRDNPFVRRNALASVEIRQTGFERRIDVPNHRRPANQRVALLDGVEDNPTVNEYSRQRSSRSPRSAPRRESTLRTSDQPCPRRPWRSPETHAGWWGLRQRGEPPLRLGGARGPFRRPPLESPRAVPPLAAHSRPPTEASAVLPAGLNPQCRSRICSSCFI